MRIALVGPTHPYKGGVAAHTTSAAHQLAAAGHDVDLVSWSRLYPDRLYPGTQSVPDVAPDLPSYPRTVRPLRWDRPRSWWRAGARLRGYDLVVVVVVVPVHVPALLAVAASARRTARPPRVVVLAHNVVPHETHPGGPWLMTRMLRSADGVLVHSPEQARLAHEHGAQAVAVADLPPHMPGGPPDPAGRQLALARPEPAPGDPVRVLALGMVRDYKGVDLLLQAARDVPGVTVTVAGEFWGEAGERVRRIAADPALTGRVELLPGYVPGVEVPALLARHDVLALPYRHATASQNVLLGHAHGLPVLATAVGTFAGQVRHGIDGLVVPPGDVAQIASALRRMTGPGELVRLRRGIPDVDVVEPWHRYVEALAELGARRPTALPDPR